MSAATPTSVPRPTYADAMANLLEASRDSKLRVNKVQVTGLGITRDDVVEAVIQDVLHAQTLGSVLDQVQAACARLQALDIFQVVDVVLDVPREVWAPSHAVDVILHVREKSRLRINTGTYVGSQEGNLTGSVAFRNLFGGGERLQVHASVGTRARSAVQIALTAPLRGNPNRIVDISVYKTVQDWSVLSGFSEHQRGLALSYKFHSMFGRHSVGYDLCWREVTQIPRYASLEVREDAGHSLKSSLKHVWTAGTEDDALLPRQGVQVQLSHELAGLGGNVNFIKHEALARLSALLPLDMSVTGTLRAGAMFTLGGAASRINDRFFLGGPTSVRGFRMRGLGDHAQRFADETPPKDYPTDALGGDLYWSAGLSLYTPIPVPGLWYRPALRLHHFVNAGHLGFHSKGTAWADTARSLAGTPTVSTGMGLLLRTDMARVELNYCLPLHGPHADRRAHGFHLGIGVSFL